MDEARREGTFLLSFGSGGKSLEQKPGRVGKAGGGGCGSDSASPTSVSVDNLTSTDLQRPSLPMASP